MNTLTVRRQAKQKKTVLFKILIINTSKFKFKNLVHIKKSVRIKKLAIIEDKLIKSCQSFYIRFME